MGRWWSAVAVGAWLVAAVPAWSGEITISGRGRTTLVLVHGNYDDQRTWAAVRPALDRHFRVVTVDLPGFGVAPNPENADSIEAKAEHVAEALAAARVESAVFVGNSYGGAVVTALAAMHPERVRGLVLEDANFAPLVPEEETARAVFRVMTAASSGDPQQVRAAVAEAMPYVMANREAIDDALVDRLTGNLDAGHLPALKAAMTAFSLDALPERLIAARRRHAFPVLVVWGLADSLLPPEGAERILEAVPEARLVLLGGTGHVPHLERPSVFVEVLVGAFGRRGTWPEADRYLLPEDAPPTLLLPRIRALLGPGSRPEGCAGDCAVGEALVRSGSTEDWGRGIAPLQRSCDAGVARACFWLGDVTERVGIVELGVSDLSEPALSRACELGEAAGCGRLGRRWVYGDKHRRGVRLLGVACVLGDGESCDYAAGFAAGGRGQPWDLAGAERLYARACSLGIERSCAVRVWPDGSRAADLEAKCRSGGLSFACTLAGLQYLGVLDGGDPDPVRAAVVLRLGCDQGVADACAELGFLGGEGAGALLEQACAAGSDRGCEGVAIRAWSGDPAGADAIVSRIEEGEVLEDLGRRFLAGDGVAWEPARGRALLERACRAGRTEACWE